MERAILNKLCLILAVCFIFGLTSVSADTTLGTYKQNSCINLIQLCDNCTYINLTSIVNPDSSIDTYNVAMTKNNNVYSYNLCNTSQIGNYIASGLGDPSSTPTSWSYNFVITKSGDSLISGNNIIFIWILFIIAALGIFYTFFLGLAKLVTASETVYGVLLSWAFFLLIIIVSYMAQNTVDQYIYNMTNFIMTVTVWTNCVLPVISLIITMFVKGTQKRKPIGINELGGFKYG